MGFWRVLYRCGRTIGHLTVREFTVTGVPLFMFACLVSSWEMDGKAERRGLATSACDNERAIALSKNALRAYEGKSSELIPPGPRSLVGRHSSSLRRQQNAPEQHGTGIPFFYIPGTRIGMMATYPLQGIQDLIWTVSYPRRGAY